MSWGKGDGWGQEDGWGKGDMMSWRGVGWDIGKGYMDKSGMKGCKGMKKGGEPDVVEELGEGFGVIKSFNAANGYGFIDCPEMKVLGYEDVFVHMAQIGRFQAGDQVVFTCF